jgi:hypothetical protein
MKLFDFKWMLPVLGDYFTFYGGGGKGGSAPPPPDYTGAANATAAGNLEAARASAAANRVNQVTPYGTLTYTQAPTQTLNAKNYQTSLDDYQTKLAQYNALSPAQQAGYTKPTAPNYSDFMAYNPDAGWSATQVLSPDQQKIADQTSQLSSGLLGSAQSGLNYANQVLSQPGVDTSKLAQTGINPGQSYQDAMMARLAPQIERENAQLEQQLANRGIAAGTDAYNQAKTLQAQNQNDRLNSATVQGMNTGLAANQQGFQQAAYNQMQPINVINALRTGSQVQNPNFANVPNQATTAGPDLLGATNAQYQNQLSAYNAQQAAGGGFLGGLMSLGGSALMAPTGTFSDERLKTDIKQIGTHKLGIGIYTFKYKKGHHLPEGTQVGVMAQEVEKVIPEAVTTAENGYKLVNYGMI